MESFKAWVGEEELKAMETTDSAQVAGFARQTLPMSRRMYPEPTMINDEKKKNAKNMPKLPTV